LKYQYIELSEILECISTIRLIKLLIIEILNISKGFSVVFEMSASGVDWRNVRDVLELEDKFREVLADILKEIKKSYRFGEYEITDVTTAWEVGKSYLGVTGRYPDITVFVQGKPFLIIECKRALEYSVFTDLLPALKGEGSPKGNWLLPRLTTVSSPSVGVIGPGQSAPLGKR